MHVLDLGSAPDDAPELRRQKRFLAGFAIAVMPIGIVWSAFYWVAGERLAALFPLLYTPLAAAALIAFAATRDIRLIQRALCATMLLLPLGLHFALGGFAPSSGVVLWAVIPAFTALVFCGAREGLGWLVAFALAILVAALVQPRPTNELPEWVVTILFALNIGTISAVSYTLLAIFTRQLAAERQRSEELLFGVLPRAIAARMREGERTIADAYDAVTVLFADVVGSTPLTVTMPPGEVVALFNEYVSAFDAIAARHGVEKIRTIGDNWMGVSGAPRPRSDHAAAMARAALEMRGFVEARRPEHPSLEFRMGINSGPVIGGVIGTDKHVFDIWGDVVNTAARMESHGVSGSIQVTDATYALLRDGFDLEPRGAIEVKGKGAMRTWLLIRERTPAV